jgi:hypothetical protein
MNMTHNQFVAIFGGPGRGGGFSAEYKAVHDTFTNKPSAAVAAEQDTLVKALVDGGAWGKLDLFYLFAQENNGDGEALKNWVNPGTFDATLVNTPTFTSLEGFRGGGADCVDTNYNPSTNKINFSQNSCCGGIYLRDDTQESKYDFGAGTAGLDVWQFQANYASSRARYYVNTTNVSLGPVATDSRGLWVMQRENDAANVKLYRNGSNVDTEADASTGIPSSTTVNVGARGAGYDKSTRQFSCFFLGSHLTTGEITTVTNAIEAYMDSNGKGVIS